MAAAPPRRRRYPRRPGRTRPCGRWEGVGERLAYAPAVAPSVAAALVRGARAVVLPVVSESAGLAAIEAIASGTPIVASAVGALPEVVGAAGLLVEPGDPSAWPWR